MSTNATKSEPKKRRRKHKVASREEWIASRKKLLEAEKELTRRSDRWRGDVRNCRGFESIRSTDSTTDEGSASLVDLFRGRSQLLIYHFHVRPDYTAGCPSCSAIADGFNGIAVHLANHDVMLWAVSRAPLEKLQEYKRRMGWTFPLGVLIRQRFQFRFRRIVYAGATARRNRIQLTNAKNRWLTFRHARHRTAPVSLRR